MIISHIKLLVDKKLHYYKRISPSYNADPLIGWSVYMIVRLVGPSAGCIYLNS